MGGGDHGGHANGGDFRNKVWSMPGGPNCRPKHWKRNTAIAMFGIFLVCIPIAMTSAKLEELMPDPFEINDHVQVGDYEIR
ncbi:transmembrane protein [Thalictrum thalictroides]|uniref:Transmembrane protein n=1 Tax=Thalictrum thalictroides TaxID=46969 RepID=A0A7J6VQY3_THATH|nr:transmembrane protein [Thalictrum thalictroides]